jgi:hypothetical protein
MIYPGIKNAQVIALPANRKIAKNVGECASIYLRSLAKYDICALQSNSSLKR